MSTMAKTTQPRRRRLEFDDEFKMAAGGYRMTIDLDGDTCDDTVCPGCGEVWWSRDVPSNERTLIRAVVGLLRGTFPDGRLAEGQERAPDQPPDRAAGLSRASGCQPAWVKTSWDVGRARA